MPAVEIERLTAASPTDAWAFISNMDRWAPLLTGYQHHQTIDERHSRWTVRGELAGLSRTADFDVTITEWVEPTHVAFTLQGTDEPFAGEGAFRIAAVASGEGAADMPTNEGWWARWRARWLRWLLSRLTGRPLQHGVGGATASPVKQDTMLSCRLEINASGGSGPVMNLLLPPILTAVADDTATKIVLALNHAVSDHGDRPVIQR
nr:SRPBCC family protein [Sphingomonas sp. CDS-1]